MPAVSVGNHMRMLSAGDSLGRWVVSACVNPGIPRLYTGHRHDDEELRVLLTTLPKEGDRIDQLRREAAILRDLDHPAVPALVDFGLSREHGVVWMATADFHGETLQDRLLQGPLPWKEACRIFHAVAEGLRYVHTHGIVHRDVHPGKILIGDEGDAKVVGFEAALRKGEEVEENNVPMGPVSYLAPEVITMGADAGPRADLYALGVSFFEALTGLPAFPAALMDERVDPRERMLDWKTRSEPLRPSGSVPDWLGNLVAKATHPDPKERLPDLDALVGWLEAARAFWEPEPEPVAAPSPTLAPPPLVVARPSIAPLPQHYLEHEPTPSVGSWMAMAYTTAAGLGVAAGLVFGVLVILMVELPAIG